MLDYLYQLIDWISEEAKKKIFQDIIEFSIKNEQQKPKIHKIHTNILFRLLFSPNEPLNFVSSYLQVLPKKNFNKNKR